MSESSAYLDDHKWRLFDCEILLDVYHVEQANTQDLTINGKTLIFSHCSSSGFLSHEESRTKQRRRWFVCLWQLYLRDTLGQRAAHYVI